MKNPSPQIRILKAFSVNDWSNDKQKVCITLLLEKKIKIQTDNQLPTSVLISSGPKLEMFMCPLRMNSGLLQICTVMKV